MNMLFRAEPEPVVTTPNPKRERRELGPNQLAWLAKHVNGFRYAKKVADKVQAESNRSKEKYQ